MLTPCLYLEDEKPEIRGLVLVDEEGHLFRRDASTNDLLQIEEVEFPVRLYPFGSEEDVREAVKGFTDHPSLEDRERLPDPVRVNGPV